MGVDLETYRQRIGNGVRNRKTIMEDSHLKKFQDNLIFIICVVLMLLLLAGIESNPGPNHNPTTFSPETENRARLSYLLIDIGTDVLRWIFDQKIAEFGKLQNILSENKHHLQQNRNQITNNHWGKLYPLNGPPDSATFDIVLIRFLYQHLLKNKPFPVHLLLEDLQNQFNHDIADCGTLYNVLAAKQHILRPYYVGRPKLLNPHQWQLLYPNADTKDFDITLLSFLFRNLIGVPSPTNNNWNLAPANNATTFSDDLVRLRLIRNELYGHIAHSGIDDIVFEAEWLKLETILIRLNASGDSIDKCKADPISEAQQQRYENMLRKLMEDDLADTQAIAENLKIHFDEHLSQLLKTVTDMKEAGVNLDYCKYLDDVQSKLTGLIEDKAAGITDSLADIKQKLETIVDFHTVISDLTEYLETQGSTINDVKTDVKSNVVATTDIQSFLVKLEHKFDSSIHGITKNMNNLEELLFTILSKLSEEDTVLLMRGEKLQSATLQMLKNLCINTDPIKSYPADEDGGYEWGNDIQIIQSVLKDQYRRRYSKVAGIPFIEKSHFPMNSIFVPLKLVERKCKNKWYKEYESTELYRYYYYVLQPNYPETSSSLQLPTRYVIKGDPGSGKTTQCEKMAFDWANQAGPFKEFHLVLLLNAREFTCDQDISEAILSVFPQDLSIKETECIKNQLTNHRNKILIIIDGYDELLEKRHSQEQLKQMVWNKLYTNCHLIITTRPWCVQDLKCRDIDAIFTVCHFDMDNVKQFIHNYFLCSRDQNSDYDWEEEYLIQSIYQTDIESLAKVPLHCLFLCLLWDHNNRSLPNRKTDIYAQLLDLFKQSKTCLPDDWENLVISLGKLALDKLMVENTELIFEESQLRTYNIDIELACSVGLLTKTDSVLRSAGISMIMAHRASFYSFLHLSIQEYMAAQLIYNSEGDEYNQIIAKLYSKQELESLFNVMLFICGKHSRNMLYGVGYDSYNKKEQDLSKMNDVLGILQKSLAETQSDDWSMIISCWQESGFESNIKWTVITDEIVYTFIKHKPSSHPCLDNVSLVRLDLYSSSYDEEEDSYPNPEVNQWIPKRFFRNALRSKSTKCLSCIIWEGLQMCLLLKSLSLRNFSCLCHDRFQVQLPTCVELITLLTCSIQSYQVFSFSQSLCKLSSLQKLDLQNNDMIGHGAVTIFECLSASVQHINMENCGITDIDLIDIASNMKKFVTLKTLNLKHNLLQETELRIIENLNPNTIEELYLAHIQLNVCKEYLYITGKANDVYFEQKIENKMFYSTEISDYLVDLMSLVVSKFQRLPDLLTTLGIGYCSLTSENVEKICSIIENSTLEKLILLIDTQSGQSHRILQHVSNSAKDIHIRNCNITNETAEEIANSLRQAKALQTIDIAHNEHLGDGAQHILQQLPNSIKHINMTNCGITGKHVTAMAQHLQKFDSLEKLILENNTELDFGVQSLMEYLPLSVTYMDLNYCGLTSQSFEYLISQSARLCKLKVLSILQGHRGTIGNILELRRNCETLHIR